ncbi:endoribonuclease CG2145-like [Melitaea cinxia]|uniref:endoribonuclease CG2145-like n=1 Tax=Melitaea cinxia TaxID=113334 RepID=UPI001E273C73|nr:endoribonuclease CG2145-like [Melitaea cinxia]
MGTSLKPISNPIKRGSTRDQRHNPINDFLLHEAGGIPSNDKNNNYNANFPSLPSSKPIQSTPNTNINYISSTKPQPSGKRDYVAPQRPTVVPSSTSKPPVNSFTNTGTTSLSPKRDYVAPQFPTLKPIGTQSHQSTSNTTPMPRGPPKRDYVAPPSNHGNPQPTTGKVKDLINLYDSISTGGTAPSQKPSYSSVLLPKGDKVPTQHGNHDSTVSTANTPKPISFSSVISGSNKPTSPPSKPGVSNNNLQPTNRPGSPVLPSTIVNNQGQNSNSNGPSDVELQTLSEELLRKDVNNAAKYITVNYQEKTTGISKDDKAPLPLLTIAPEVWNITTIQKMLPLLDNYERDTSDNEHVTAQERNEENAFLDAIMSTTVIRHLMSFLKDKGYVTPDPKQQRDYLKQMWFGLYSRGKGKISSSGFEHVFVSELKNLEVLGLHNWIYFSKEESANRINYLGYLKYVTFNNKGAILKMHMNQQGVDKPINSMFIGTSPELEIALYTLCYVTRVDNDCNLKLDSKDIKIITYNYRYRSKNYIGSAFPQI